MEIKITTTITSTITIDDDGIQDASHAVLIDGDPLANALPHDAIMATVKGGCRSVIQTIMADQ